MVVRKRTSFASNQITPYVHLIQQNFLFFIALVSGKNHKLESFLAFLKKLIKWAEKVARRLKGSLVLVFATFFLTDSI